MSVPKTHFHPAKGQKNGRSVDLFFTNEGGKTNFFFLVMGDKPIAPPCKALGTAYGCTDRYATPGLDNAAQSMG